jgi:hypothetical protein
MSGVSSRVSILIYCHLHLLYIFFFTSSITHLRHTPPTIVVVVIVVVVVVTRNHHHQVRPNSWHPLLDLRLQLGPEISAQLLKPKPCGGVAG